MSHADAPQEHVFFAIHKYLLSKGMKDKGRVQDFGELLLCILRDCKRSTVQSYLTSHRDFHHHNLFKGNRYHDLRQALAFGSTGNGSSTAEADEQLCVEHFNQSAAYLYRKAGPVDDAELRQRLRAVVWPI